MGLHPQQNVEKQISSVVSGMAYKITKGKARSMNCLNDSNGAMALRKTKQISHPWGQGQDLIQSE